MDRWNRFCDICEKNCNEKEEKVQKIFEHIFASIFEYNPFEEEIDSHRILHIGSKDRAIPDIIIYDYNKKKDLFNVELKQLNMSFDKKYEAQLLSYMRLLSLNVGILICDAIYVYVLDNDMPSYSKIEIVKNNVKGKDFIDMFSKGNFSTERVKEFVLAEKDFEKHVQEIKNKLMLIDMKRIVKSHFADHYKENEIDEALKSFEILIKKLGPKPLIKETTQDWIRRIFTYLFKNNILTHEEIYRLHDSEYSKITFAINYAMLVDRERDTTDSTGHARYWKKKIGNYFVCSQWWLDRNDEYDYNIRMWLKKVFPDYAAHGLERYISADV